MVEISPEATSIPPDRLLKKRECRVWTRSTAVRGLVGLGRWSYCLSSYGVGSVRSWLWVRGCKRGLGEQGGGWKQRLSQMMSLRIPDSQIERATYHCLAELSYIINKLVLAFSDAGISDIWVQISGSPCPIREK